VTRPFRLEEDERRYFALRSEFFIRLVQSGVPTQTVHEIMRNFGKLEDMMFFEGLRQGMAVAILTPRIGDDRNPVWLHAELYGDASTPLHRVELAEMEVLNGDGTGHEKLSAEHPWLSDWPMRFGPLTLNEAIEQLGPDLTVKGAPVRQREPAQRPAPDLTPVTEPALPEHDGESHHFDPLDALERLANGEDPAIVLGIGDAGFDTSAGTELKDLIEVPPAAENDEPVHRPALLDRVRDILGRLDVPPQTWQDLILMLMRETQHDASYLDNLMSTPMGMTVISQAKLFHLHPGAMPEIKAVPPPMR
jgi:hypothetical protein